MASAWSLLLLQLMARAEKKTNAGIDIAKYNLENIVTPRFLLKLFDCSIEEVADTRKDQRCQIVFCFQSAGD